MPPKDISLRQGHADQPRRGRGYAPEVSLLGGFELRAGPETLRVPLHAQRLVAFLALHERPLHRTYVAGRLWLEVDQGQANRCLRSTLWRLRRLSSRLVVATNSHLALAADVAVDVRGLETAAARVLPGGPPGPRDGDLRLLADAGELLPDWYEDWVPVERERLRQVRLIALESLAHELIDARQHREATLAALAAVTSDPLRESAHRALVRCHLATGNVGDALRQFGVFREHLDRELGLEPSPGFRALLAGLESRGRSDMRSAVPRRRARVAAGATTRRR